MLRFRHVKSFPQTEKVDIINLNFDFVYYNDVGLWLWIQSLFSFYSFDAALPYRGSFGSLVHISFHVVRDFIHRGLFLIIEKEQT